VAATDQDEPAVPKARWGRRILWTAIALVGLIVLYIGGTFVQVWQASRSDGARKADAIVVLGAAQYNGTASPALQNRLDHALALYEQGLAPLIVVTGGKQDGDRYTEATVGYNYLRDHGVPDEAIRKEVQGHTTYESVAATARFLRTEDIDDVILVSGPATAKRLAGISSDVGLDAAISPSEGTPSFRSLLKETAAVSAGRLIGYRRLERFDT
jgi:vancomycin permeability regulator SanA